MIINHAKRIYMNEADGSPGGGAAPAAPAEPPAAPAAPAPASVSIDQVKGLMTEMFGGFKNALFADMRKAGVLGKEKPSGETPAPVTPAPVPSGPAPTPAAISMADVQALLDQDRVITRAQVENKLTDAQVKRMRSALLAEKPDDVSTWTSTYLADMGFAKPSPQPATQATQSQAPAAAQAPKPNISDRGTASPTDMHDSEGVINARPLEATAHDVDALILKHGRDKGLQMFAERVNQALRGVRLESPSRGGRQR